MTQDGREDATAPANPGGDADSPENTAVPDGRWERLRAGDESERVALYERHRDNLAAWFRGRLPAHCDAEDCVSEVFVRAFDGIARGLEPRNSVDQWLWGIARHVWMAQLEAGQRRSDKSLDDVAFESDDAEPVGAGTVEPAPGLRYGKRQAFAALYTAAETLSPKQRTAVGAYLDRSIAEMRTVKGTELAAHLGWSTHTVDVELSRAMPKVMERVGLLAAARSLRSCPKSDLPVLAGMLVDGRSGADLVPTGKEFAALRKHAPDCVHCGSVAQSAVSEMQWALGPGLAVWVAWQSFEDDEERRGVVLGWWTGRTPTPAGGTPPVPPVPVLAEAVAASGTSEGGALARVFGPATDAVVRPVGAAARKAYDAAVEQLLRIPGVPRVAQAAHRVAAENPLAVRLGGAAVTLAAATALTIAAVVPDSPPSPAARPGPPNAAATAGPSAGPTGERPGGPTPAPTSTAPAEGGTPGAPGATTGAPTGSTDPLGGSTGPGATGAPPPGGSATGGIGGLGSPSGGTGSTGGSGKPVIIGPTGSTGNPTGPPPPPPPPPPAPAVWGFWMIRFADDPIGTTRELTTSEMHPVNHEGNWTHGVWRMGNPPVVKHPRVTHTAVGRHTVTLPDTGAPGGIVQVAVSDYAPAAGVWCQPVAWWQQGRDEVVDVACFDRTGAAADVPFTGLFLGGAQGGPNSLGEDRGYVHASDPSAPVQTPSSASRQGTGPVTRTGTGSYAVVVAPGTTRVQVSPVGAAQRHCALTGLSGGTASIACTTHGGTPADTAFALSHTGAQSLLDDRRVPHGVSLTVTDAPGAPAPAVANQWMSKPGSASVTRTGVGQYTLRFNVGYLTSYTHVTATGSGYCTWVLRNDYSRMDDVVIYLACYNAAGVPTNGGFQLTYMTASPHYR